jgi:hypothetical protein
MNITTDYDLRSLQHERRMLDLYRRQAPRDGGLLQPLANACWRAAAFDWHLHEDTGATRRLCEEAARALTEGFVRKRAGFDRGPEDLLLAVHFAIASRSFDLLKSLMHLVPAQPPRGRSRRPARSQLLLLEGYLSLARAIIERKAEHARAARSLLEEARVDLDRESWRKQFPTAREVDWRIDEHEATRRLLSVIARHIVENTWRWEHHQDIEPDPDITTEFFSLMDSVMLSLDRFIESELKHNPKLYFWLPGIAVSILAESAGLPLDVLQGRYLDSHKGYVRLPLKLVYQ